jgi:hypothetical protein
MVGTPGSKREFEHMVARHKLEIERALRELDARMARIRSELDAAREEVEQALERGLEPILPARKFRDSWGNWPETLKRKRRPRRGFEGGDPVPVEPRPKPKPLLDGAEAPVE